jgi:hypothetical protein
MKTAKFVGNMKNSAIFLAQFFSLAIAIKKET